VQGAITTLESILMSILNSLSTNWARECLIYSQSAAHYKGQLKDILEKRNLGIDGFIDFMGY
jgi:hypothetical protein